MNAKIEYATKTYVKKLGGIVRCYPLGRGEGLFTRSKAMTAKIQAASDGWKFERLIGVGHDYNLNADIYVISRTK